MDDKIILERIQQGDKVAFENMMRRYYTTLCAFVNHVVKNQENAEDIIQELFVKLWVQRHNLAPIESLKDYLFISARNHSLTFLRGRKRLENHLKQIPLEEESNMNSYVIEEENNRLLLKAIEQLPPRSSEVIRLSLEGLKQEEIAAQMHISINTVKSLKYEAIAKLRQTLGPLLCLFLYNRFNICRAILNRNKKDIRN